MNIIFMISKNKKAFIIIFIALIISGIGCKKYNFNKIAKTEWKPSLAFPLIYTDLGIEDLVKEAQQQGILSIDPDNFVTLIYEGDVASLKADEFIDIPDQSFQETFNLTAGDITYFTANNQVTVNRTQTINFDTGGDPEADSTVYKTGVLEIDISSTFQHDITVNFTIPAASKNGTPYNKIINLDYKGSTPVQVQDSFLLDGYHFDFTQSTNKNEFDINYTITVTSSGQPISAGDYIEINQGFENNRLHKFFGYVGQKNIDSDLDSVNLNIFDNTIGNGKFSIAEPKITISFINSYGIPVMISFKTLEVWDPAHGTKPVMGSGVPANLVLNGPKLNQIGQSETTDLVLNHNNSNIAELLEITPDGLVYQVDAMSNPAGVTHENFVIDTSRLDIRLGLEIPLYGTLDDFELTDTLELNLDNPEQLKKLLLRAYFRNGFPFDVETQVFMADSMHNIVDSLFSNPTLILASAGVDGNGKVNAPAEKITDIELDKGQLENLGNTQYLILKVKTSTLNQGQTAVRIYSDYMIHFKLGVKADVELQL